MSDADGCYRFAAQTVGRECVMTVSLAGCTFASAVSCRRTAHQAVKPQKKQFDFRKRFIYYFGVIKTTSFVAFSIAD